MVEEYSSVRMLQFQVRNEDERGLQEQVQFVFLDRTDGEIDSAAVRQYFEVRTSRFATKEELQELTGLVPGCIPPFGEPILPFELYVDESITKNEKIAFNAGSLTDSIIMATEDYLRIAKPTIFTFAVPLQKNRSTESGL